MNFFVNFPLSKSEFENPNEILKGKIQGEKKPRDNGRPRRENNKH
jgi:hypothetical protein